MKYWVWLTVEYGFCSETYDFSEVLVQVDEEGNILRRICEPWNRMLFWLAPFTINYGYGYENRDRMYVDIANRKIQLPPGGLR